MTSSLHNGGMLEVCPGLINFFKVFHQFLELMLSNLSFFSQFFSFKCFCFTYSCSYFISRLLIAFKIMN